MQEIASGGQLRMALLRWLLLTVPAVLGLGALSMRLALSAHARRWFAALQGPQSDLHFLNWGWVLCYMALAVALALLIALPACSGGGETSDSSTATIDTCNSSGELVVISA